MSALVRAPLAIAATLSISVAACGSSAHSPTAPSLATGPVAAPRAPALTVTGTTTLAAIGETTQLSAILTSPDGRATDVTTTARWTSQDVTVVTVRAGLVSAVGFGATRVDVNNDSNGYSVFVSVTPAGTFAAAGDVREPGQGPIEGVRVSESASRRSTLTDAQGNYKLAGLATPHLVFEKDGYESAQFDAGPNNGGSARMQRVVRINAGDIALIPKLTHADVSYTVGGDLCSPCRLVRIVAARSGVMHFDLTWDRPDGADLYLWVGDRRFEKSGTGEELIADAQISAGENVVYVGYYQWKWLSGSSISAALATSMNP